MFVAAALVAALLAASPVPTPRAAQRFVLEFFPPAAPGVLLDEKRGRRFHTERLTVRNCRRTPRQVECDFNALLEPFRRGAYVPIRCRGEVWVKRRSGELIGRPGDYTCVNEEVR